MISKSAPFVASISLDMDTTHSHFAPLETAAVMSATKMLSSHTEYSAQCRFTGAKNEFIEMNNGCHKPIVDRDVSIMSRLMPGEILTDPETRESNLKKELRLKEQRIAILENEIASVRRNKKRQTFRPSVGLSPSFCHGDYDNHQFIGQCSGGTTIMFRRATLSDVILQVDNDDVVIFWDCYFENVKFEGEPGFILLNGEQTYLSNCSITRNIDNWSISIAAPNDDERDAFANRVTFVPDPEDSDEDE